MPPTTMGEEPPPGGGPPSLDTQHIQQTTTPEQTGGGNDNLPRKMRTFEEIMSDEKKNRNILTLTLTKIVKYEAGKEVRAPSLTMEDIGEFVFDVMKLKMEDCAGLSLTTQRYDTKLIHLKPGIDPNKYISIDHTEFKGHMITITQQTMGTTKVTFRNVPMNIPDEEIINLCKVYGTPINNIVNYEQMPRPFRGIKGPNRSVNMKMAAGKQFENFYWMEGPLDEDVGCRITVLHAGQAAQCSHCLRRGNCPAMGNGRACQSLNTPRGKISDYMRYLKECHKYVSLKMQYRQKIEQEYPALGRKKVEDDGFGHMVEPVESEMENKEVSNTVTDKPEENILKVDPNDFQYDETSDTIIPLNIEAFEKLIEEHPSVHTLKRDDKRDGKVAKLKEKVLDTLKLDERKKRDLSCESIKSDCSGWGHSGSLSDREKSPDVRGATRLRSEDDEPVPDAKKSLRNSRSTLRPPKIVISKQQK